MICATSNASAEAYRTAYGFARATGDWRVLVDDHRVEAVVIASPQETHRAIETATPVWPTFEDGLQVSRIIAAARHSAASGAWVTLEAS